MHRGIETSDKMMIQAERVVKAPPSQVYRYIADYREHHEHFLPPAFSNLTVERGGVGDGTLVSFEVRVGGRTRHFRVIVDEPDPGRVLKEISLDSDSVTTFQVVPDECGSRVTITSEWTPADGLEGWLERRLAPRMLDHLYQDELARLDIYARQMNPARRGPQFSGVAGS